MHSVTAILEAMLRTRRADVLIIVPPFGGIDRPSLGVHILQAVANAAGFDVSVLYANLLLAQEIGIERYNAISYAPTSDLLGERFFSVAAFGHEPAGVPVFGEKNIFRRVDHTELGFDFAAFDSMRTRAAEWCEELALAISRIGFKSVGCTTTFEQTGASVALLNAVKRLSPSIVTIIGGANCEGEMARGVASLGARIDHIFSGESEISFVEYLNLAAVGRHLPKIVEGRPNLALDSIETPKFDDYYNQVKAVLSDSALATGEVLWLPYESSRGCWWGQKHHCTFCGINGEGIRFRQKTPDRVMEELKALTARHPSKRVLMVDNIMPYTYFRALLPRMADELPGLQIFYEQKANLTLEKVTALRNAGVAVIQPGIEALSTPLLELMRKGVTASHNIALLRYASAAGLAVNWNLLFGFPNDEAAWYLDTARILPFLRHLSPPTGLYRLSVDRFSPYYDQPSAFGLRNVRPGKVYGEVFPKHADLARLAYHFEADYSSGSLMESSTIDLLSSEVQIWKDLWQQDLAPKLHVSRLASDEFALYDTRNIPGNNVIEFIDTEQASAALLGSASHFATATMKWAFDRKLCVSLDGDLVPLAVAAPKLIGEIEAGKRTNPSPASNSKKRVAVVSGNS